MFFKWSSNTVFIWAHIECSLRVVHYVLSVLIIDYKFKQQKLTFVMVVKFCCDLQLHLKPEILISFSRKMSFVRKKAGDKVPWNTMSAIS